METIIIRRRWRWIGHVLRKEQDAIPRVAVQWRPEGHRKRGRPKTTWRRTVEAEAAAMGQSWGTLRMLAQDREQWKEFVAALIAYGKKGSEEVRRNWKYHALNSSSDGMGSKPGKNASGYEGGGSNHSAIGLPAIHGYRDG
ncbi:hypothetical protein RRG08_059665 [Elysia crispata]|uniref:Uncharacterized protein n=1 Tax=Elysia crispata TaxID=231223 RepID=A0AAE1E9R7_9GAST|nr:hypothetical protein RRG08_059665 [Elysia crispata]